MYVRQPEQDTFQFTLTSSHRSLQALIHRTFEGREGEWKSLTLPSHFGSHSLTSHSDMRQNEYAYREVRARRGKSEGDVRENEYPSRVFSPLYIGL